MSGKTNKHGCTFFLKICTFEFGSVYTADGVSEFHPTHKRWFRGRTAATRGCTRFVKHVLI